MGEIQVRVGLYPGTFDPAHNGHLDVISRAVKLVDKLVIAVNGNPGKNPLFSLEERVAILREETTECAKTAEIEVIAYDSQLTVQLARSVGAQCIIRALRAVKDFEFEFQMTAMNQVMAREIETVFLMADPRHQAIASSLVKEIFELGGDTTKFVPAGVSERLQQKYGRA
jgi:pantetheine-phosphate adenylyltransferase